jgi:hypothetical protein
MQSVFSTVCPESGKTRRVSRECVHVISACSFFVFRVELSYACKKCSVLANELQFSLLSPNTFMLRKKKLCRKLCEKYPDAETVLCNNNMWNLGNVSE